ncbi:hypothetical protein D3C72_1764800 [compost metagenome]
MGERHGVTIEFPHPRRTAFFGAVFFLLADNHIQVKEVIFAGLEAQSGIDRFTVVLAEVVLALVIAAIQPVGGNAQTEFVLDERSHCEQVQLAGVAQIFMLLQPGIGGDSAGPVGHAVGFFGDHVHHAADGVRAVQG